MLAFDFSTAEPSQSALDDLETGYRVLAGDTLSEPFATHTEACMNALSQSAARGNRPVYIVEAKGRLDGRNETGYTVVATAQSDRLASGTGYKKSGLSIRAPWAPTIARAIDWGDRTSFVMETTVGL